MAVEKGGVSMNSKRMTGVVAFSMVFLLSFFLVACGGGGNDQQVGSNSSNSTQSGGQGGQSQGGQGGHTPAGQSPSLGDIVEFDGVEITLGANLTTTTLDQPDNPHHGATLLVIPITIKNVSSDKDKFNIFNFNIISPSGAVALSPRGDSWTYEMQDQALKDHRIARGESFEGVVLALFDGNGEYRFVLQQSFKDPVTIIMPVSI